MKKSGRSRSKEKEQEKLRRENPAMGVNNDTLKGGYCENSCMYQTGSRHRS
jgi:hypothetical protein